MQYLRRKKNRFILRFSSLFTAFVFLSNTALATFAQAQLFGVTLPAPGSMVKVSSPLRPTILQAITVHPDNPLRFDFVINPSENVQTDEEFQNDSKKLIKYFLASLTTPEDEMWVNLSPYESERIIPESFGYTEMGRDLLAQDYLLKQITASLMYPEDELGEKFWNKVRAKASNEINVDDLSANILNKVWIVPEQAEVYENNNTVIVISSHLKVMLEEDYLALQKESQAEAELQGVNTEKYSNEQMKQIIRDIIIPEIEWEVNNGANFANLRQIYNSMILATWYKIALQESLLGHIYMDKNKVRGVDVEDKDVKYKIYNQYLEAFKLGAYNYIKEEYDPATQQVIPRKYFSGGTTALKKSELQITTGDFANLNQSKKDRVLSAVSPSAVALTVDLLTQDAASLNQTDFDNIKTRTNSLITLLVNNFESQVEVGGQYDLFVYGIRNFKNAVRSTSTPDKLLMRIEQVKVLVDEYLKSNPPEVFRLEMERILSIVYTEFEEISTTLQTMSQNDPASLSSEEFALLTPSQQMEEAKKYGLYAGSPIKTISYDNLPEIYRVIFLIAREKPEFTNDGVFYVGGSDTIALLTGLERGPAPELNLLQQTLPGKRWFQDVELTGSNYSFFMFNGESTHSLHKMILEKQKNPKLKSVDLIEDNIFIKWVLARFTESGVEIYGVDDEYSDQLRQQKLVLSKSDRLTSQLDTWGKLNMLQYNLIILYRTLIETQNKGLPVWDVDEQSIEIVSQVLDGIEQDYFLDILDGLSKNPALIEQPSYLVSQGITPTKDQIQVGLKNVVQLVEYLEGKFSVQQLTGFLKLKEKAQAEIADSASMGRVDINDLHNYFVKEASYRDQVEYIEPLTNSYGFLQFRLNLKHDAKDEAKDDTKVDVNISYSGSEVTLVTTEQRFESFVRENSTELFYLIVKMLHEKGFSSVTSRDDSGGFKNLLERVAQRVNPNFNPNLITSRPSNPADPKSDPYVTLDLNGLYNGINISGQTVDKVKPIADSANLRNVGGIDFNPMNMNLEIRRDGRGVPLPFDQQLPEIMQIEGLVPVIIKVAPANVPLLLGFASSNPDNSFPSGESASFDSGNGSLFDPRLINAVN